MMPTREARKILREYHEAVKAVMVAYGADSPCTGITSQATLDSMGALKDMLPKADLAVKALTERFP